jgi:hypothetical protein
MWFESRNGTGKVFIFFVAIVQMLIVLAVHVLQRPTEKLLQITSLHGLQVLIMVRLVGLLWTKTSMQIHGNNNQLLSSFNDMMYWFNK